MIFRPRPTGDPVSFTSDSDSYLLTFERSRSEQDCSVRVFCRFAGFSMQFCEIERFHEGACQTRSLDCIRGRPLHRHQVTGARWLGRYTLPMAAHFLWATVHFTLNVKPNPREQAALSAQVPTRHRRPDSLPRRADRGKANPSHWTTDHRDAPFSLEGAEKHSRWEYRLLIREISSGYPCFASILSRETALSDFPHSRQTRLARGVIRPQYGHILCNRPSSLRGLNIASNVPRNFRAEARRRPRDGRYGSIRFLLLRGLG